MYIFIKMYKYKERFYNVMMDMLCRYYKNVNNLKYNLIFDIFMRYIFLDVNMIVRIK